MSLALATTDASATEIDDLDAWLSSDDVFTAPFEQSRARLVIELRRSVGHHLSRNAAYERYCRQLGFRLEELDADTLDTIPMLPSGLFKVAHEELTTPGAPALGTTSSGTQGTVSVVPRDDVTIKRFFASVAAGVRELLDIEHSETRIFNLGPTVEEAQHLWISYVMAGVSVLHETDFYVSGGELDEDALLADLRAASPSVPSVIVGPPPLILDLAKRTLLADPLKPSSHRYVVSIGGWKRRQGDAVDPGEFGRVVREAFGIEREDGVRDAFNMVELNTVLLECSARRKHCPPWLYPSARDARTLAPQPDGEPGVLAFADPTPASFPGMVLSDDFGTVQHGFACECGVTGDVISIERRINRLESRGCAMKI